MRKRASKFKKTPKKHQPKSLKIIHEDRDIVVIDKPSGLLTVGNERQRDKTVIAFLNDYVRKGVVKSRNRVYTVHRLDRETSGILVFAKSKDAQEYLQDEAPKFKKTYHAIVHGLLDPEEGSIKSYLAENGVHKMFTTKDARKGKHSETCYKTVKTSAKYSLVKLTLPTSRKHQIRVHLSDKGHPVAGDKKYNEDEKGIKRLTLHATSIVITHPFTKKEMTFTSELPSYFESFVKLPEDKKNAE